MNFYFEGISKKYGNAVLAQLIKLFRVFDASMVAEPSCFGTALSH